MRCFRETQVFDITDIGADRLLDRAMLLHKVFCKAGCLGADAEDIGLTIHPHPTLVETIGMAAEVAEGSCTDLPPARKRK